MNETGTMEAQSAQVLDPLREDHRKVKKLFEEFEAAIDSEEKQGIVENAIKALPARGWM